MIKIRIARFWVILAMTVVAIIAGTILGTAVWNIVRAWGERLAG